MALCFRMLQQDTDKTFSPWRGSVLAEIDQGCPRSYRWRGLALVSVQVLSASGQLNPPEFHATPEIQRNDRLFCS